MKSSLAFLGGLLVAFTTFALTTRAIDTNRDTPFSHPSLDRVANIGSDDRSPDRGLIPESDAIGRTPGVFIPNLGQVDHDVYFQLIGPDQEAHFRARSIGIHRRAGIGTAAVSESIVDVRFVGANRRPEVRATGLADERLAYVRRILGKSFTASVPLFSEVTYEEIYDGVDLRVSASGSRVTRRFSFKPGVSIERVLLHYDGADNPVLLPTGAILIPAKGGVLKYTVPEAVQEIDGKRVAIPVGYHLGPYGAFGFRIGQYDASLPVVIEVEGL